MSDKTSKYNNAIHCAATVLKNEGSFNLLFAFLTHIHVGPLAFYKGFTMCFLRLWPHSVISLLVFEQLRKLSGIAPV